MTSLAGRRFQQWPAMCPGLPPSGGVCIPRTDVHPGERATSPGLARPQSPDVSGAVYGLGPLACAELAVDRSDVRLDRVTGDDQLGGDLTV